MNIDWPFVETLEGRRLSGYVPADRDGAPIGKSGVTVAAGVDLGALSRSELGALGLTPSLAAKLLPYVGARGTIAQDLLRASPLRLSPEEADALEEAVRGRIVATVARAYDEVAAEAGAFEKLPPACQTILASVSFQYGPHLSSATPRFWRLACAARDPDDWRLVAAELDAFGDHYAPRRRQEAAYLRAALGSAEAA